MENLSFTTRQAACACAAAQLNGQRLSPDQVMKIADAFEANGEAVLCLLGWINGRMANRNLYVDLLRTRPSSPIAMPDSDDEEMLEALRVVRDIKKDIVADLNDPDLNI